MDVQLICSEEKREELRAQLMEKDINIVEKAEFILYEKSFVERKYIFARDKDKNISLVEFKDVIYFESFNKITEVVTENGRMEVKEKLYMLEDNLLMQDFVRVNKSIIINMLWIEKIIPWIGSKFALDMKNGDQIEVTRTYFSDFKKRLGL